MVVQIKLKLDNRCSNNQVEQLAILKALKTIDSLNKYINPRTATIFTDSRVSLDSLHNPNNHAYLVEEIRKMVTSLERCEWKIMFSWVKAHVGIYGNELEDRLAKEAARNNVTSHAFSIIPRSTLYYETAEKAKQEWQDEWTTCDTPAATKQYFPTVWHRLGIKIKLTPNLAVVLSGHGKTRAYFHHFKLRADATCICGQDVQTTDHLLFPCTNTHTQREVLKQHIIKTVNWPASKQELITKYRDLFCAFKESIDFELLQ